MADVLIVVHHERGLAADLARQAVAWLSDHGHVAWLTEGDALAVGLDELACPDDKINRSELAVSLGGDGTMLRTLDLVAGADVPVIGVNAGLLGYLTEVEPDHLADALHRFFSGEHAIEERMMLSVTVQSSVSVLDGAEFSALNEAVLEKTSAGHTVRLLVTIGDEVFTSYAADGLIVATPTGSTAYSLSARGPILSPRQRALLLTPVSPHMLFDRSLVLAPDEWVTLEVLGHRPATLSIDGRGVGVLHEADRLICAPAAHPARLVTYGPRNFHQILKAKFGLHDR